MIDPKKLAVLVEGAIDRIRSEPTPEEIVAEAVAELRLAENVIDATKGRGLFAKSLTVCDALEAVRCARGSLRRDAIERVLVELLPVAFPAPPSEPVELPVGAGALGIIEDIDEDDFEPTDADLETATRRLLRAAETARSVGAHPDGNMLIEIDKVARNIAADRAWREASRPKAEDVAHEAPANG